jgi:hypothetical protein
VSVEVPAGPEQVERIEGILHECGLRVLDVRAEPARDGRTLLSITVHGKAPQHDAARLALLKATSTYRLSVSE